MAITYSANFQLRAAVNDGNRTLAVHLYYDSTHYIAMSITPLVIGVIQHIACVKDVGSIAEQWKIGTDNQATLAAPQIELIEYTSPDGTSLAATFHTNSIYGGQRIIIYRGYDGLALSDYAKIFDGKIDEPKYTGDGITLSCLSTETPETEIQGGKIDAYGGKIDGRDVAALGVELNKDVDGMYIPVPFGYHWNAPGLPYEIKADLQKQYAFNDVMYDDKLPASIQMIQSQYRHNLNRSGNRILVPQDERLVPVFPESTNADIGGGTAVFAVGHDTNMDSSGLYSCMVLIYKPSSCFQCLDDHALLADIPLRLRPGTGAITTSAGASLTADHDVFSMICDADAGTYIELNAPATTGTSVYAHQDCTCILYEQLGHDSLCVPRLGRLISIQSDADLQRGSLAEWRTLILGRCTMTDRPANQELSIYYQIQYPYNTDLSQAYARAGVNGREDLASGYRGSYDYNYFSSLYEVAGTGSLVGWVKLNPIADAFLVDNGSLWNSQTLPLGTVAARDANRRLGVGDGGNYDSPEALGMQGFLSRAYFEAYDKTRTPIRLWIVMALQTSVTDGCVGQFYDVSLHSIAPVETPTDEHIYTDLIGHRIDTDASTLLSMPTGTTGVYILQTPAQYLETIIRVKAGSGTDGLDKFTDAEWQASYADFNSCFGTVRNQSGFVLTEKTKLNDFLKEYLKYEPFSVFMDSSGFWRYKQIHKDLTDIEAKETIHTLAYSDAEGQIEFGFTPKEQLCLEIKACKSDRIYGLDRYAVENNWYIDSAACSFAYWDADNALYKNKYFIEEMELKYTSSAVANRVTLDGITYGCLRTNTNQSPDAANSIYWTLLSGDDSTDWGGSPSAWSNSTLYYGDDAENWIIAKRYLNMWCNRHRTVRYRTKSLSYLKLEIGDYVQFADVPDKCAGLLIKGFGGEESDETVAVNGQDVYYTFIVTGIRKDMDLITIDTMQCHNLDQFSIIRRGSPKPKRPGTLRGFDNTRRRR